MQVVKRTDPPFCYTSPGRTAVRGRVAGSRRRGRAVTGGASDAQDPDVEWLRAAAQREVAGLERTIQVGGLCGRRAHEDLAGSCGRGQAGRDVDAVSEGSEVDDRVPDRAHVGEPRVDARPHRDPWTALAPVAGRP